MCTEKIYEKLNEVFRYVFDDNTLCVTESTSSADIEDWDSLTHITLIAEVEEAFGMKFFMKEVVGMKNVGDMAEIISKRGTKEEV